MNEQEKLETQFVRAESYWNASFQVLISSNRYYLLSSAAVRTTSGLVAKRELVKVQPGAFLPSDFPNRKYGSLKNTMLGIAPWAFIAALASAAMAAIFLLLPVWR